MTAIAEKLLKRHDAIQIVEHIKQQLQEEARRRQDFREWIDDSIKAEFINGEIIMHSPVKKKHWEALDFLSTLLSVYVKIKRLGSTGVEKVMIGLTRNDYEPDIVFFNKEKAATFEKNQMIFPAPDFVVEILSSRTEHKDRGIKKQDYAEHGIKEYWLIDPERQRIEQYLLLSEKDTAYFEPYIYTIDETIESRIIKDFKIPVRAIFEAEANSVALQQLMQ